MRRIMMIGMSNRPSHCLSISLISRIRSCIIFRSRIIISIRIRSCIQIINSCRMIVMSRISRSHNLSVRLGVCINMSIRSIRSRSHIRIMFNRRVTSRIRSVRMILSIILRIVHTFISVRSIGCV